MKLFLKLCAFGTNLRSVVWILNVLLLWMVWPASAQTALDNGPAGSSGCGDDTWAAISTVMAPSPRSDYAAVWTGSEMIVWGGYDGSSYLNTGGRYDPDSDSWTPINTVGAPSPRAGHTAVWTGKEMIVWGGGTCGVRELLVPTAPSKPEPATIRPRIAGWPLPWSVPRPAEPFTRQSGPARK